MMKLHCDICDGVINETDAMAQIRYTHYSAFKHNNGRRGRKSEIEFKGFNVCINCCDKIKDFVEKLSKNGEICAEKV